jgi:hypothetical protein
MTYDRKRPNGKAQPPLRAAENFQNAPDLVRAAVGCSAGWAARRLNINLSPALISAWLADRA